ncbi:prepilin-type N-terminal cleavage/methylation domain-containing protein [Pusillimonas sp. DMV24BSW_D]|uniref:type II secretion system protein n=1 Tax=Neopusillimonas aestuarii TaxID=2716226 RepID=UPI00140DA339|nr:prepilin-type N-terminal cleavage/methylation domain-containing protein [Pusillimonas sp. DMV24BSW_D]QIM49904.1 prepilin-type N-terminal cleavage/methylation domain-containing protein [Pusillimonas sp. DMV24BSW_D]
MAMLMILCSSQVRSNAQALRRETDHRGFALLELIVAALISTLLAVWAADMWVNRINDSVAQSSASWMRTAKTAATHYLARHGSTIRMAESATALNAEGYENWARPTISELINQALLPQGFPARFASGPALALHILRSGACPGQDCDLQALIYTDGALMPEIGSADYAAMQAQWLLAARGEGGAVFAATPNRIAGASFEFLNPPEMGMTALPAGAVAMAVTVEQTQAMDFLKVKDERDPQFQAALSVQGTVTTEQSLRAADTLWLGYRAFAQAPCSEDGLVARENFGGLLVCRGMRWVSAGGVGGGGFSVNSSTGCTMDTMNPVTGACTCPTSYTAVRIADSGIDAGAGRTRGYMCVG